MQIKINRIHLAAAKFQQADHAWSEELSHIFGRDACNARYEKRGKGHPGSTLRTLYDAREAARITWEVATGLKADCA